jgi:hypothetical protein
MSPIILFTNPPESNPNVTDWQGGYPYQRNIYMDFGGSPLGDGSGPISGAIYQGADDPYLWDYNYVSMTGDIRWDETTGTIDLYGGGSGTFQFHIDNWDRDYAVKNIYIEFDFSASLGSKYDVNPLIIAPEVIAINVWSNFEYNTLENTGKYTGWIEFQPNPLYEELDVYLSVPDSTVYIDNVHIATQCVPVPGAIVLAAIGFGFVGWLRRQRTI